MWPHMVGLFLGCVLVAVLAYLWATRSDTFADLSLVFFLGFVIVLVLGLGTCISNVLKERRDAAQKHPILQASESSILYDLLCLVISILLSPCKFQKLMHRSNL